jgi:hypothetical protein
LAIVTNSGQLITRFHHFHSYCDTHTVTIRNTPIHIDPNIHGYVYSDFHFNEYRHEHVDKYADQFTYQYVNKYSHEHRNSHSLPDADKHPITF